MDIINFVRFIVWTSMHRYGILQNSIKHINWTILLILSVKNPRVLAWMDYGRLLQLIQEGNLTIWEREITHNAKVKHRVAQTHVKKQYGHWMRHDVSRILRIASDRLYNH